MYLYFYIIIIYIYIFNIYSFIIYLYYYYIILLYIYIFIIYIFIYLYGPGSSVGIANYYGLDAPGSNPGGDEIFRLSRPTLGPTQFPVKLVPGLSRG